MASGTARLVKNAGITFTTTSLRTVSRMVLSVVTARLLGPVNLGVYNLVGWFTGLSELFVNLGIAFGVTKFVAELDGQRDRALIARFVNFALLIKSSVVTLVVFLLVAFSGQIAGFFKHPEAQNLFVLGFLALIPGAISGIFSSALVGIQNYTYSLRVNLVFIPFSFMASVLALMLDHGVVGLLVVGLAVSVVRLLANFAAAAAEGVVGFEFGIPEALRKRAIRFNAGVTIMNFLDFVVWQRSEVFFLGRFRAIQEVGFYSLAYGFTSLTVNFVSSAIGTVLFPLQSQAFGEKNTERMKRIYHKSLKYSALVTFPVAAGGIALAEPLIRVIYGAQYLPAVSILMLLFLSAAGARVGGSFASLMYSTDRVGVKVKFGIGYAILNVVLDLLLIPQHGIWGAALANSGTQFLGICIGPFVIYYFFRFEFPLLTMARVGLAAGLMGAALRVLSGWLVIVDPFMLAATVALGALLYALLVVAVGALDREDVRLMRDLYDKLPAALRGRYGMLLHKLEALVK